ncbi:MAG: molecular chaperone HtpG [Lachnospiraceae bacterium]|nr:molecular chaperone HtpG [Lachnospiraceae bacterium]
MDIKKGNLSIDSENIFPIIKQWLYSDHDIFYRELISNGCDAITKLKKLDSLGEWQLPEGEELKMNVFVNQENKTITFTDNGIGMTAEEMDKYINQIAFSGAKDFLEKYKDKEGADQIIGHFGLGFYSAFMVADKVTIDSLSYKEGSKPVYWESEGGMSFEMSEGEKDERGTTIVLYLNEDSYEFSNAYKAKEIIDKYCSFMPVPIFFKDENAKEEEVKEDKKEGEEKSEPKKPEPINEIHPLWTKAPSECKDEEYKKFYRDVFNDFKEPLFWIHLNMDYPFNLKGILYFPKINTEYDSIEGKIKLYSNQVFIADNIKEVIPEFLLLLKGVIDCPDLPLNVSRSALQNDGFVKKISDYITKKVADKLIGMFKTDRENYEKYWDDLSPFIKFGCLKDDKFRDKIKDFMIYKNLEGKYITLPEYVKASKGEIEGETVVTDENGNKVEAEVVGDSKDDKKDDKSADKEAKKDIVYYVTDEKQQSQYINMFKENGKDAVILTHNIDQPFISQLEYSSENVKFLRIDAEVAEDFKDETSADELKKETDKLTDMFRKALNKEKLEVKVEKIKSEKVAAMITLSEESRRMQDMMKMYAMNGMNMGDDMFGAGETLVLNANHALVKFLFENPKNDNANLICEQLYDLASLAHKPLEPEAMTKFVERSNEIMLLLTK